jgi:hypothetical protein
MFSLLDSTRSARTLEMMNGADLCSDWGTRSLSPTSSLFEPTNYNYGASWPFISSFFATAQFKYHYNLAGYSSIESVAKHVFDNALGVVPEVFSGDINQKLAEGYHHQGFSTTGYMLPYTRGLVGLEVNAITNTVTFSPHFPANWDVVKLQHVTLGKQVYDFQITQSDSGIAVQMLSADNLPCNVVFSPDVPPGSILRNAEYNGTSVKQFSSGDNSLMMRMSKGDKLIFTWHRTTAVLPPILSTAPGASNYSLKVISQSLDPKDQKELRLVVEGKAGESYRLNLFQAAGVAAIQGAVLEGDHLNIVFDKKEKQEFLKKEITIELK